MKDEKVASYVRRLEELKLQSKQVSSKGVNIKEYVHEHNHLKSELTSLYKDNKYLNEKLDELPHLNLAQAMNIGKLFLSIIFPPVLLFKNFTIYDHTTKLKEKISTLGNSYDNILFILSHKVIKDGVNFFSPETVNQMMEKINSTES